MECKSELAKWEREKVYVISQLDAEGDLKLMRGFGPDANAFASRGKAEDVCKHLNAERVQQGCEGKYVVSTIEIGTDAMAWAAAMGPCVRDGVVQSFEAGRREEARTKFFAGCRLLFEQQTKLQSFSWEQRSCCDSNLRSFHFNVWGIEPGVNGLSWDTKGWSETERDLQDFVSRFLCVFDSERELMRELFGDGVTVTVYRDGKVETKHDKQRTTDAAARQ